MRRRNHAPSWQTPLPSTAPRNLNSPRNKSTLERMSTAIFCSSILCLFVAVCVVVAFLSVFQHSAFLPSDAGTNSLLGGRGHMARLLNPQLSSRGVQRPHKAPIKYVNLQEIQSSSHQYDVIVVGCGPAGLTGALFASRMGMSVLVIGSPSAGSLSGTSTFDNFPSFFGHISSSTIGGGGQGQGWIDATLEQASHFGAQFAPPTLLATGLVEGKVQQHSMFEVHLSTGTKVLGKSVIVASGSAPRKLNLPHESTLWGHSLHNCALCDGDIYVRDGLKKSVAVIGGGDAAVEAIFLLHKLGVDTIHWIHRRDEYRASPLEVEKVSNLPNVEVWASYVVTEWITKGMGGSDSSPLTLEGIRIVMARNGVAHPEATTSLTIPCDGAFLMIGSTPNSEWLQSSGLDIDPTSKLIHLSTTSMGSGAPGNNDSNPPAQYSTATSIEGIFAAGEVVDGTYRQALTASSEGAKAAIDAQRYLRNNGMEASVSTKIGQAARIKEEAKKQPQKAPEPKQSDKANPSQVDCDLTKRDCIQQVVSTHPVVVFSKSYCPYCRRALEALRSFPMEPLVIDLTQIQMGGNKPVQDMLAVMTGRRTVPNVFVGGVSIGGGDETTALFREGKLEGLLRKAGAIQ